VPGGLSATLKLFHNQNSSKAMRTWITMAILIGSWIQANYRKLGGIFSPRRYTC
jgi:hypothetical protein